MILYIIKKTEETLPAGEHKLGKVVSRVTVEASKESSWWGLVWWRGGASREGAEATTWGARRGLCRTKVQRHTCKTMIFVSMK